MRTRGRFFFLLFFENSFGDKGGWRALRKRVIEKEGEQQNNGEGERKGMEI